MERNTLPTTPAAILQERNGPAFPTVNLFVEAPFTPQILTYVHHGPALAGVYSAAMTGRYQSLLRLMHIRSCECF